MARNRAQRRLSAIMSADVVGYTRLMGRDEEGTLAALKDLRADIVDPAIEAHGGRIVKLIGDGALIEFSSVVAAVECALAMQAEIGERNAGDPEESRIQLRIGVNLGDVIIDGDDIYGDGVNVAARLEGLAVPGGICVSATVYEQVRAKLDADFSDLGEQRLKNVDTPLRAWAWPAGAGAQAAPAVKADEKPSIAVLPFDNLSGDPDQEFFADGMTEDLITDLSKISGLFVVARNSSSRYRGRGVDVREAALALGVRYVHEGSVRKAGDRVRINAQLIDAQTGGHLWADRYDGALSDVFELQDKVCAEIVKALSVQLSSREAKAVSAIHTANPDAYELFVRARATPFPPIPERIQLALKMYEQVIDLDPDFAGGYAGVSSMMSFGAMFGHKDPAPVAKKAIDLASRAIAIDEDFGWLHSVLARALILERRFDEVLAAGRKALSLQPSDVDALSLMGILFCFAGEPEEGLTYVDKAIKLNPLFVDGPYLNVRGNILAFMGEYESAAACFEENMARKGPIGPPAITGLAVAYQGQGRQADAQQCVADLRQGFPDFTIENWVFISLCPDHSMRDRYEGQLRQAGAP